MTAPHLILFADGLLSKWGFGDGDMPDNLWDWLDEHHPDLLAREGKGWRWHDVLRHLVRHRLIPALDQRVELVDIETIHNPIRAKTVDGVDVTHLWRDPDAMVPLTPDDVAVPYADVVAVIRELAATNPAA